MLDKNRINIKKEKSFFRKIEKTPLPKLPIDGKYLIKRGIKEGKKIGNVLKEAESVWIDKDFNLSSEDLEKIIKKNTY